MEELRIKNGKIRKYLGYRYCIVRFVFKDKPVSSLKHDWGCAYVEIPEFMFTYIENKYDIFPVHGGVTFKSDNFNNEGEDKGEPAKEEFIVMGWDYGHLEDVKNYTDKEIKKEVMEFIRWISAECSE